MCIRDRPDSIQSVCYSYFARVVLKYAGNDLDQALQISQKVQNDRNRGSLVSNLLSYFTIVNSLVTFDQTLEVCRNLNTPELHQRCVGGLAVSLVQSATPGQEYDRAMQLCKLTNLSNDESKSCYKYAIGHIKPLVSNKQLKAYCAKTPKQYISAECTN